MQSRNVVCCMLSVSFRTTQTNTGHFQLCHCTLTWIHSPPSSTMFIYTGSTLNGPRPKTLHVFFFFLSSSLLFLSAPDCSLVETETSCLWWQISLKSNPLWHSYRLYIFICFSGIMMFCLFWFLPELYYTTKWSWSFWHKLLSFTNCNGIIALLYFLFNFQRLIEIKNYSIALMFLWHFMPLDDGEKQKKKKAKCFLTCSCLSTKRQTILTNSSGMSDWYSCALIIHLQALIYYCLVLIGCCYGNCALAVVQMVCTFCPMFHHDFV